MKKSVIKRRKRVVPASQGGGNDGASTSMGSPESDDASSQNEISEQRGSINPDGSVNLGFKHRSDANRARLPEPTMRNQTSQPKSGSDLTAYASSSQSYQIDPSSLTSENKLPPMTSWPSPTQRRPSLSPSSFLSPSRKRSFPSAEAEPPALNEQSSKRLSSIKSILNPPQHPADEEFDQGYRSAQRSPYPSAPSPSSYANSPVSLNSGPAGASDGDRAKLERRDELRREAERMREALKAKERELEALNDYP
jgi:GATA-binding protein